MTGIRYRLHHLATAGFASLALLLGGCATTQQPQGNYRPVMPRTMVKPPQSNGAIYQAGYSLTLYEDLRARRVGDILTIVLEESTQASKSASTSATKDSSTEITNPTLIGNVLRFNTPLLPNSKHRSSTLQNDLASANDFSGEGDSSQSNSLSGNITVTVSEVLPNGYLLIRGEKWLTLNQGEEYIQISGMVRPTDVRPDNTISSSLVADARITYSGKGAIADANSAGWLTKFFLSPIFPF